MTGHPAWELYIAPWSWAIVELGYQGCWSVHLRWFHVGLDHTEKIAGVQLLAVNAHKLTFRRRAHTNVKVMGTLVVLLSEY